MSFVCQCCGQRVEGRPLCFGADAPWRELVDSENEFESRVSLEKSLCVVDDKYFFIRGQICLPILGTADEFVWSVWCSLSQDSFRHVLEHWDCPNRVDDGYFGWLCSALPCYPTTTRHLKTNVRSRGPGVVPLVEIQEVDHPIYREQQEGISVGRWHQIVHELLHGQ